MMTSHLTDIDPQGLHLIIDALAFAARKHRDQRRKGLEASPYINHPIAVAHILVDEGGISDAEVIAAAILHDTIEDTQTTHEELVSGFGQAVADIVLEVTDDKSLLKQQRKAAQIEHAPHLSPKAKLVKLADKICNTRDLVDAPPQGWQQSRILDYLDWAQRVIAGVRGAHASLELAFDQAIERGREAHRGER